MKRLLLAGGVLFCQASIAQEMWGIANSNFAGSSGMNLNPASMVLMPYKWEATLITADIFFENNYLGYSKRKTLAELNESGTDPYGGLVHYGGSNTKSAYQHVLLKMPAFIIKVPGLTLGVHAAMRHDLVVRKVPVELATLAFEGLNMSPYQLMNLNANGMRLETMPWVEVGISAGKQLNKSDGRRWIVAGTLNILNAFQAAYIKINNGSLYIPDDSSLVLNDLRGTVDYAFSDNQSHALEIKGRGAAVDIGGCYVSNPYRGRFANGRSVPMKRYDYRIGASLIDAGFVSFSRYATSYKFNTPQVVFNDVNSIQANGLAGVDSLIQASFMNGKAPRNSFVMALPIALSVQYDKCLMPGWYMNFSIVQRVPLPMPKIDRPNNFSATIRYERTFFEVAIPYSFYDYYQHRIGLAVRYHFFFIGSDKMGTFISKNDVTGEDLFFGIKLTNMDFAKHHKSKRVGCAAYF